MEYGNNTRRGAIGEGRTGGRKINFWLSNVVASCIGETEVCMVSQEMHLSFGEIVFQMVVSSSNVSLTCSSSSKRSHLTRSVRIICKIYASPFHPSDKLDFLKFEP